MICCGRVAGAVEFQHTRHIAYMPAAPGCMPNGASWRRARGSQCHASTTLPSHGGSRRVDRRRAPDALTRLCAIIVYIHSKQPRTASSLGLHTGHPAATGDDAHVRERERESGLLKRETEHLWLRQLTHGIGRDACQPQAYPPARARPASFNIPGGLGSMRVPAREDTRLTMP